MDAADIRFVTGVPDSLLKDVCACMEQDLPSDRHAIAANEGSAVGLAIGHYLATGRPALVYMQNSGLGNSVNPIASLADPEIYAVPVVFLIGWRGEVLRSGEQLSDEPQHRTQGKITTAQLEVLGMPVRVVDASTDVHSLVPEMTDLAVSRGGPVAMLVRKGSFETFSRKDVYDDSHLMARETAIEAILNSLSDVVPVVATTGMASRELFEIRKRDQSGHQRDFLTVGGMGHASQIATGIAISRQERKVICLDGDGALLMHMGGMALSGRMPNLVHVVLNNGAHDSVGGQPTYARSLRLSEIAQAFGFANVHRVSDVETLKKVIEVCCSGEESQFVEVLCRRGARPDLGRPDRTPGENKADFMCFLGSSGDK